MSVASIIIPSENGFTIYEHGYDSPVLAIDDLAAVRGDGIFEVLLIDQGQPINLDRHLVRLTKSASAMNLVLPPIDLLTVAINDLASKYAISSPSNPEGQLRIAVSRGRESHPQLHCFLMASPIGPKVHTWRSHGVSVVTLNRGFSVDYAKTSPWGLLSAKTLSYATNMAAIRYAIAQGADDAIYTSNEGWVLEASRGAVVIRNNDTLTTTPLHDGILASTTQAALFDAAQRHGLSTEYRRMCTDDLLSAESVWIISSVTLAAPVIVVDGEKTQGINDKNQKELWELLIEGLDLTSSLYEAYS